MHFAEVGIGLALGLFVAMLGMMELGRWLGRRRHTRDPGHARAGMGAIDGAIFALLGLLIAFTFSGAATRFDGRRALVVQEANAIGTAWLRLDTLPAEAQPGLRDAFRRYLDARIETYARVSRDEDAARTANEHALALQGEIWSRAVEGAAAAPTTAATMLLLPALNEMIDITATRSMAMRTHPPAVVFVLLLALALASALFAGHGMAEARHPSRLHRIGFAFVMALAVLVIVDLEYPRRGFIRVDAADEMLVELRRSMGGAAPQG